MNYIMIILAFLSTFLMCLGLILMEWIISEVGAVLFFMVLLLTVSVFVLAIGDREYDR